MVLGGGYGKDTPFNSPAKDKCNSYKNDMGIGLLIVVCLGF